MNHTPPVSDSAFEKLPGQWWCIASNYRKTTLDGDIVHDHRTPKDIVAVSYTRGSPTSREIVAHLMYREQAKDAATLIRMDGVDSVRANTLCLHEFHWPLPDQEEEYYGPRWYTPDRYCSKCIQTFRNIFGFDTEVRLPRLGGNPEITLTKTGKVIR